MEGLLLRVDVGLLCLGFEVCNPIFLLYHAVRFWFVGLYWEGDLVGGEENEVGLVEVRILRKVGEGG